MTGVRNLVVDPVGWSVSPMASGQAAGNARSGPGAGRVSAASNLATATSANGPPRWEIQGRQPISAVDDADYIIEGASVQKLAVAAAFINEVNRGRFSLGSSPG